jgi:Tol biopolymer transport system component
MKPQLTQRIRIGAIAALFLMTSHITAQNLRQDEYQYSEALHKQTVGDLDGAIQLYREIIGANTTGRAVKANALLQLAIAYDKIGQQSEAVYQEIVNKFSDQPAAIKAKEMLNARRPPVAPSTMTMRKIELGSDLQNVVATDGKSAVYWDSTKTKLFSGDAAGKEKRVVYETKRPAVATVSRDLSMVFFFFPSWQKEAPHYAVMKMDRTGYRELTLIEHGQKLPVGIPEPTVSWSWDNAYLLISTSQISKSGGSSPDEIYHLLKVSVADGQTTDLLPGTYSPSAGLFSKDGRFIAYYQRGALGAVYIIPSQGGVPQLISESAVAIDWTSDGRYLILIESNARGRSLSAAPVQNGRPSGEHFFNPSSVQFTPFVSGGTTVNGTMIVRMGGLNQRNVFLGTLDPEGHIGTWKPMEQDGFIWINQLVGPFNWSPDGQQIAYLSTATRANTMLSSIVRLRNVVTMEDRELYRIREEESKLAYVNCVSAHQHPILYCGKTAVNGPTEIFSVTLDSGRYEKLGYLDGPRLLVRTSSDDRFLLTARWGEVGAGFEWEIETRRETRLLYSPMTRSADGRWIYSSLTLNPEGRRQLAIRPTSGSDKDWKPVAFPRTRGNGGGRFTAAFTSDGNWLFYRDIDANGKDSLYRVSTSNGEPERLGDYPTSSPTSVFTISPDGRQIVLSVMEPQQEPELWAVDGFVPPAKPVVPKPTQKPPAK